MLPGVVTIETATAEPRTAVSCTIRMRDHTIIQDKPPELHGDDTGPMASEILMASLLACQLSTFAKVAKKRKVEAHVTSLTATLHYDEKDDFERIELDWDVGGDVDAAGLETLLRLTDKVCTVSRALKFPIESRHNL